MKTVGSIVSELLDPATEPSAYSILAEFILHGLTSSEVEQLVERLEGKRHGAGRVLNVPLRDADLLPYRSVDVYSRDGLWCVKRGDEFIPLILL